MGMMQGYVAEIMLTLESAVDNLDVNVSPLVRDPAFLSTPNLAKDSVSSVAPPGVSSVRLLAGGCRGNVMLSSVTSSPFTHARSTSYNLVALSRKAIVSSPPILENKGIHTHLLTDTHVVLYYVLINATCLTTMQTVYHHHCMNSLTLGLSNDN